MVSSEVPYFVPRTDLYTKIDLVLGDINVSNFIHKTLKSVLHKCHILNLTKYGLVRSFSLPYQSLTCRYSRPSFNQIWSCRNLDKRACVLLPKRRIKSHCINQCLYHHVSTCTCTAVTMAKIQFLTILLVVTCFLGGVISITDKEFEVCAEYIQSVIL